MLTNILPSTNTEPSWQSVMEKFPLVLGHFCITLSQVLRWQFLMFSPNIFSRMSVFVFTHCRAHKHAADLLLSHQHRRHHRRRA